MLSDTYCLSAEEIGNEDGYLVAMSMHAREEPLVIPPGTNVTMQAIYRPEQHYGASAGLYATHTCLIGCNQSQRARWLALGTCITMLCRSLKSGPATSCCGVLVASPVMSQHLHR